MVGVYEVKGDAGEYSMMLMCLVELFWLHWCIFMRLNLYCDALLLDCTARLDEL
jgi:hypothetical protein